MAIFCTFECLLWYRIESFLKFGKARRAVPATIIVAGTPVSILHPGQSEAGNCTTVPGGHQCPRSSSFPSRLQWGIHPPSSQQLAAGGRKDGDEVSEGKPRQTDRSPRARTRGDPVHSVGFAIGRIAATGTCHDGYISRPCSACAWVLCSRY